MITTERLYPIRRPLAAFSAGAAVAILCGLIGLGGAEFRLPILIAVFALFAHRAVRINLLISLATLAMSAVARLGFLGSTNAFDFRIEIVGLLVGGVIAAWIGAGLLSRIPKSSMMAVIAALLLCTAGLLAFEVLWAPHGQWAALAPDSMLRPFVALVAGLAIGAISSLLGVAGGEFLIPTLVFIFGADIKTAGTASVLISIPIVLTGVSRHWLTGHYRSQAMLAYLAIPTAIGSVVGAAIGGYLAVWARTDALRLLLAAILAPRRLSSFGPSPAIRVRLAYLKMRHYLPPG
jgi:uncharacterized membrane protein YfcA